MGLASALPVVLTLADQVRAHLADGHFLGRTVDLPHGGAPLDADWSARIVLADVQHCQDVAERRDGWVPPERCRQLVEQLEALERVSRATGLHLH